MKSVLIKSDDERSNSFSVYCNITGVHYHLENYDEEKWFNKSSPLCMGTWKFKGFI